jgi:acylphosphatase
MIARRYIVRGRVQGVGYRNFAQQAAELTGIRGWVRNRGDGSVEAFAIGDTGQLSSFSGLLHKGPRWAQVRHVEELEAAPEECAGFRIKG